MGASSNLRVLIVKTSALGDVVQGIDAFKSLKPMRAPIHWGWVVAEPYLPLVEGTEGIDEILTIPRKWSFKSWLAFRKQHRKPKWDIIIDLQGLLKSYIVSLAIKHDEVVSWGPKQSRDRLVPYLATRVYDESFVSSREKYRKLIQYALQNNLVEVEVDHEKPKLSEDVKHIICSPGSVWPTKRLDHKAWGLLIKEMRKSFPNTKISMIAGKDRERDWVNEGLAIWEDEGIELAGSMNLKELKAWFQNSDLYVGMDSGPSHIASSIGLPTFIFYGPSLPAAYDQFGEGPHAPRGVCHLNEDFEQRCSKLRICESCSAITSIDISKAWSQFIESHKLL